MYRSPEISISVVQNKRGWHVNVRFDYSPWKTLGPYEHEITLPEALQLVAVEMKLDQSQQEK
jgi:hypothetical protein